MDEPLGALDKQLREHMQIELKALHRQLGLTFVYVTHDQSEALTMSDRVAVFNTGVIQQIESVTQLYEKPANRFVASFVGDNSVFNGTASAISGTQCQMYLPCGATLGGMNINAAVSTNAVQACIRPERIVVHQTEHKPCDNSLLATLADVIYFGDHLRLRCTLPGQAEATIKVPLSGNVVPTPGQSVWLHLPPEHLRIYL
jgi:putative spermidine/putrescine transport system ATP-binding protein